MLFELMKRLFLIVVLSLVTVKQLGILLHNRRIYSHSPDHRDRSDIDSCHSRPTPL